jgi:hypothetical protein
MIKKILLLISYLFKNNIEKSLEKNITKLECSYCESAFKPKNILDVCKINNKLITSNIHDEL